ncbi:MAG: hypothetical protein JNJ75_14820 [Cyclobacteriaceae bacterium]|nr:hypothetical protein [Cyclobacteriaceae bacterium]
MKEIVKEVLKNFWIPLLLSVGWAYFSIQGVKPDDKIQSDFRRLTLSLSWRNCSAWYNYEFRRTEDGIVSTLINHS